MITFSKLDCATFLTTRQNALRFDYSHDHNERVQLE